MAKVNGPLMSMEASGTIADTITFDRRGFVRTRVIPANPQTPEQGNVRQKLLAVQKALRFIGVTVVAAVKTLAPTSYRWNSYLLSQVLGANSSEFDASRVAFNALSAPERATWEDAAEALGMTEQSITYATDPAVTPGLALFAVARTLYRLGVNVADGQPGAANAGEWAAYFNS
jgi:hypothetical protein